MFSVLDTKAGFYTPPMYMRSVGEALRGFENEARNPESQLYNHAADFTLFQLGEFNQETGEFTLLHAPHSLANAADFHAIKAD